jgi:hypothetical protein
MESTGELNKDVISGTTAEFLPRHPMLKDPVKSLQVMRGLGSLNIEAHEGGGAAVIDFHPLPSHGMLKRIRRAEPPSG